MAADGASGLVPSANRGLKSFKTLLPSLSQALEVAHIDFLTFTFDAGRLVPDASTFCCPISPPICASKKNCAAFATSTTTIGASCRLQARFAGSSLWAVIGRSPPFAWNSPARPAPTLWRGTGFERSSKKCR